eukprot:Pgem_evm1s13397
MTIISTLLVNKRISPGLIAMCENEEDVISTVSFAKRCGYTIAVRSGGHNYGGYSSCSKGSKCIQLDVSALKTFTHE